MTEAQTYDGCLEKMAQVVADSKRAYDLVLKTPGFPIEMVTEAGKVVEEAEEAMRQFVELRLGVI